MFRLLRGCTFISGLIVGTAILAQENTGSPADGLDLGQAVASDPTYIKETYDDWQMRCVRANEGEETCQMSQLLREEAGNPVAEISIFKLPGNGQVVAGATVAVPLGTLLTTGLQMYVDDGPAKAYSFSFCSMVGCFARIGLTQDDIEALKAGEEANIIIVPAQDQEQTVLISASLKGFTEAYENTSVTAR